ncbi:ABC-F family ATP-binding cassette domain-containing protein [Acetobacterium sp.]|uniref:ABC-F family ATP-binding cassette domain-containing protein n=1 Tax=Acetobacterium sp. TaxID=1872094 RepID=UPI00272688C7|nr:ABC-F family ATP-binding cassette domain-containing protein [Acetobacterium sp.]MDO9491158.1 ABC-F family ATP-binding cassette domain-containing protein [Acetobacterium sp.]
MNIASIENLKKTYGVKTLFNQLSFSIADTDKIGVIGVNGSGKTSLLRIIGNLDSPDAGEVKFFGTKRVEILSQDPDLDPDTTVLSQVFSANSPEMNLVRDYESTLAALDDSPEDGALQKRLMSLSQRIDDENLWNLKSQVETILSQLGIHDYHKQIGQLSGGQRKRVAMASALLTPCDLLILDEPTNHLDNDTIAWLENYLLNRKGALLMVTHDRYFLDRVVTKTIELDMGNLYEYTGNYSDFLEQKANRREAQTAIEAKRQNLYRRELAWIRRGARARTTKQKARIQRFDEIKERATDLSENQMEISVGFSRLGKKVIEIEHLSKSFGPQKIIADFSMILGPSERIGIIGKNGYGKSTLLNLLAGKLKPDGGTITLGDTVKLGYFSQESEDMDLSLRAIDYIREKAEVMENSRGETVTAAQMMELFLFDKNSQWVYISELSGGERRRLYLLGILMMAPNVLLFDEPTNDLDIDTLTILEAYLDEFQGSVLTVSHDRYFLDRTCEQIFSFDGKGQITTQTGNYSDYIKKHPLTGLGHREDTPEPTMKKAAAPAGEKPKTRKPGLTYKEKREQEALLLDLEAKDQRLDFVTKKLTEITKDYTVLQELAEEKAALEEELLEIMDRLETLENLEKGE